MAIKCFVLTELEFSDDFLTDGNSLEEGQVCVSTSQKDSVGVRDSPVFWLLHIFS